MKKFGDRRYAIAGDQIPGERLPRAGPGTICALRVVDRGREFAEISISLLECGYRQKKRQRILFGAVTAVRSEKEDLVLLNRPSQRAAEFVLPIGRTDRWEKAAGVQETVADVLECQTMELVGPGLQHEIRRALPGVHHRGAASL